MSKVGLTRFRVAFAAGSILLTSLQKPFAQELSQGGQNGSISGRVFVEGYPVSTGEILAFKRVLSHGRLTLSMVCSASVNEQGGYLCDRLAAGTYLLEIRDRKNSKNSAGFSEFQFYFQATELALAEQVSVHEGEQKILDINRDQPATYSLTGSVPPGNESCSVQISATDPVGEEIALPTALSCSGITGEFAVAGLPSGTYSIHAHWTRKDNVHTGGAAVTIRSHNIEDLKIDDAGDTKLRLSVTSCLSTQTIAIVSLERIFDGRMRGSGSFQSPLNGDAADFEHLAGGQYRVLIEGRPDVYVAGTATNGRGDLITIPFGADVVGIGVTLNCDAASLSGEVDQAAEGDRRAIVVLLSRNTGMVRLAATENKFRFDNLSPGNYSVCALPQGGVIDVDKQISPGSLPGTEDAKLEPNNAAVLSKPLSSCSQ